MVLNHENVEKFKVETVDDGILLKAILLDAITAGDALEKKITELEASVKNLACENAELRGVLHAKDSRIRDLESECHWDDSATLHNALIKIKSLCATLQKCKKIVLSGVKNGIS